MIKFYKKMNSLGGREIYIFLIEAGWEYIRGMHPYEEFLEQHAGFSWHYGGNMYLEDEHKNRGLIITNPTAALFFMMSEHCIPS